MEIGAATLRPISLFYSYSHRDEEFRSALETHLSILRRSRLISEWHDRMIGAGGDWRGEIDRHLVSADIVLLLVSADFLASDYCWGEEMAKALQRHERGEARVIPVILRPCRWRSTPLAKLQAVPRDGKPVTDWLSRDTAFDDIAAAIERIIEDQQKERLRAAEEEERRRAELETKRKAEEERKRREQEEAEARQKEEERRRAEAQRQAEEAAKRKAGGEKPKPAVAKWIIAAAVVLVVVLGAIFVGLFPDWTTVPSVTSEKERPVTPSPSADAPKTPPPDVTGKTTADARKPAPDVAKTTEAPPRTFRDCDDCPLMVALPGGAFTMGSRENEESREGDEGPQRQVTIAPFAMGKTEVTFDEWDACVAAGGCNGYRPSDKGWGRDSRPVIHVSWKDAKAYVGWLSKQSGKPYRLPTEAEWEYAARAGTTTPFSFGETITTQQANYDGRYTYGGGSKGEYRQQTVFVGSLPANSWGLHEMHGNVWEWVEDCWHDSYQGAPRDGSAWTSGQCSLRVFRGGSWLNNPRVLRSADRNRDGPDVRYNGLGFRVARTLTP